MTDKITEIDFDQVLRDNPKDNAVFFLIDEKRIWIPRSQITGILIKTGKEFGVVEVSEWFALQKGLI